MKLAILPGDGIGPELMDQAVKVIHAIEDKYKLKFNLEEADIGGAGYDSHGTALPDETVKLCNKADAILLGAIGGPKWDNLPIEKRPERVALLGLRQLFKLYINLRPAMVFKTLADASPLRKDIVKEGFNILFVRELTGGIYFGKKARGADWASDEMKYNKLEIERIAKFAFEIAMKRKKVVTSIDKANVLTTMAYWREVVNDVAKKYPKVKFNSMYVDNASMQLIKNPHQFDVVLTGNMFGDILSDEAAMLTGSLGMLPSASLRGDHFGLYEPAGGSAPDIAGLNIANPIAQILSVAMMMRYSMGHDKIYVDLHKAVENVLNKGYRTDDIMQKGMKNVSTDKMGDLIVKEIK